jgi:hypothetical protein
MPAIFSQFGFVFFFYSNEHLPIHIHVKGKGGSARFELEPEIKLTDKKGLKVQDIRKIERIIRKKKSYFIGKWHDTF